MALNGIDISNWQKGINLAAVPADFVIAKATQGTRYVSPDCARQVEQARATGKRFGVYHYVSGGNAVAEANYFVDNCSNWIGKGLFCIDWEADQNSAWGNEGYLEQLVTQVKSRTGIPPIIYASASRYAQVAPVASRQNCGLWIAQYANMNPTGYQNTPWNEGAYACVIRQYSASGRLPGYNGNLDLNKFYGDGATYDKYVTGGNTGPASTGTLAIDGNVGPATVRRWQQVMGTTVDGIISGQVVPDGRTYWRPAIDSSIVHYGAGGSDLIRAVQRHLGCSVDGLLGPATIRAIQAHYGLAQDASFGPATARALQSALNQGRF